MPIRLFAILWLALACAAVARSNESSDVAPDGPYVVQGNDETWTVRSLQASPTGAKDFTSTVRTGSEIHIPAVGRVAAFSVTLRPPAVADSAVRKTHRNAPVFVVADTHGEYEILVELLHKHRIVDASMRWSFGRGHLVFLGDVFDRGAHQTEILWLIYKLEAEAAKAGGGAHLVLGNHESMVMNGNLRYLNSKYLRTAQALGVQSYAELFGPRTLLGQWLRTKPAVLKLNDLLCLHGGISRALIDRKLGLPEINSTVRDALNKAPAQTPALDEQASFVMGQLGPLWYRGYFADQRDFPTATPADIDEILAYFGVSRIMIGHTIVPAVTPLYGGRVIAVQVYPRLSQNNGQAIMEAVRIDGKRVSRAKIDGGAETLN